ncbi:hypothetical protein T08_3667 [Trichinella sp. T8]|nr:hypothetical protein T08_3667 [Trichinella sp. T8]
MLLKCRANYTANSCQQNACYLGTDETFAPHRAILHEWLIFAPRVHSYQNAAQEDGCDINSPTLTKTKFEYHFFVIATAAAGLVVVEE